MPNATKVYDQEEEDVSDQTCRKFQLPKAGRECRISPEIAHGPEYIKKKSGSQGCAVGEN